MKFESSPALTGTSRLGATGTTFRLPRRRGAADRFRVSLRPLVDTWETTEPRGYLVQGCPPFVTEDFHSPAILQWTLSAVAQLQPDALLAFALAPEVVTSTDFAAIATSSPTDRLVVILEQARIGRRRDLLLAAMAVAGDLGIAVAVTGNRVASVDGFAGLVVSPGTAAYELKTRSDVVVIATDIVDSDDLDWAREIGATYVEGPALAAPLEMAPIVMPTEHVRQPTLPESEFPALAAADR